MTIPYRICLRPGCCRMVKIDELMKSAVTCDGDACKMYMEVIADANIENKDGGPFNIQQIGREYYKMIKIFNATLDKTMIKKCSDGLRRAISQVHNDIISEPTMYVHDLQPAKRSREEYEMDDDPTTVSENNIKKNIIATVRDMTDDEFLAINDQESLARFCYETVLTPYGSAGDFDMKWMTRADYV